MEGKRRGIMRTSEDRKGAFKKESQKKQPEERKERGRPCPDGKNASFTLSLQLFPRRLGPLSLMIKMGGEEGCGSGSLLENKVLDNASRICRILNDLLPRAVESHKRRVRA